MSYDISFKAKLEGVNQWVPVGDTFINLPSSAATMVKEACGSYPSPWAGRKCADMYPVLMEAASLLSLHPGHFKQFEDPKGWGTVASTMETLMRIADNCDHFPTAVFEVTC